MTIKRLIALLLSTILVLTLINCDGGLEPIVEEEVEPEPFGVIVGTVTYTGDWPPQEEFIEFFFVPLPYKPQTFLEVLLDEENLRASDRLSYNVDEDTFIVDEIENGTYIYNIIANQFGPIILTDWRPLGVYSENDGVIIVRGDTTYIEIEVDFNNLPPFPPD